MTQRSPVPDWFGKEGAAPGGAAASAKGKGGCAGFVLGLLLAGGVAAFAWSKSVDETRRAGAAEARAAACEASRREEAIAHAERIDEVRRQAAPVPSPATAAPEPPTMPDLDAEEEPEQNDDADQRSRPKIQVTLRALKPRWRACYENALAYAPDSRGKVVVVLTIDPSGTVSSARANSVGSLPSNVAQCVAAVVKTARFEKSDSSTTVSYPIVFEPN